METPVLTNGYHDETLEDVDTSKVSPTPSRQKPSTLYSNNVPTVNKILPAEAYTTSDAHGRVLLRLSKTGNDSEIPMSVPGLMNRTVARYPDKFAYASKNAKGTWDKVTFRDYQQNVRICAKAFLKLGLEKQHSVCVLSFNCPQWFISDLAAIHAGGFAAGIYTTNNPDACHHVLSNSRANIVVCEDAKQMDKIREIWPRLPLLKAAIQLDGNITEPKDNIYSWTQIMAWGKEEPDTKLNEAMSAIAVNECCTLVYTSGTVGSPKGVMLSHDNVTWEAFAVSQMTEVDPGNESLISYLPLSHVAAQILDIVVPLMNAVTVYFADKDALKGSLIKTIQEVQPTRFLGVPRVWEKIYEKMASIGAANGMVKKGIANWAKAQSTNHYNKAFNGIKDNSYGYWLAQNLVLKNVKAALGFSNCKMYLTAAAPLSIEVKAYFMSLDMPIMDVFGMSESSGAHSFGTPVNFNLESVGKAVDGVETMLGNKDAKTGEGEICIRGRHVFMGYLNEPTKTNETFDDEGWLKTGDVGKIDDNGYLYITGRIKELLITAGGENVAPVIIEQEIKKELPCVSQAIVIGDRRKFLSVLLTLKTEIDSDTGIPLDKLSSDSIRWVNTLGEKVTTVAEILSGPNQKIMKAIQDGITRANVQAISNAQKIQKFAILPCDLSIATDELGPTLKLKRNVITTKYASIIESLYT